MMTQVSGVPVPSAGILRYGARPFGLRVQVVVHGVCPLWLFQDDGGHPG